jgi:hypothetical protein
VREEVDGGAEGLCVKRGEARAITSAGTLTDLELAFAAPRCGEVKGTLTCRTSAT